MIRKCIRCVTFYVVVIGAVSSTFAQDSAKETSILGTIERLDPAFDQLVPKSSAIEVLADGFEWSEGPVWIADRKELLFSDIPRNQIVRWDGNKISVFLERSGYTGTPKFTGEEPGSNGLMLDAMKRLTMCQHGDRQVSRLETDGKRTVLASHYDGKRLNSPNDLIYHSNGDLYFTDPPYGLPKRYEDPTRELDWCGVYRLSKEGKLTLLTKEMTRPNGIAFSPDEKTLYVAQSDPAAAIWKAFPVKDDGTLGESRIFFDATKWVGQKKGLPDGMVVDQEGNIWATGPGGVLVFSAEGKLLGMLNTGEATANCTFGEDGSTLFITADMYLCRVKTSAKGLGF